MRKFGILIGVLIGVAIFERPSSAQNLTYDLFGRTVDSLRAEAGIPGMSVAVVKDGVVVWATGMGLQDIEGNVVARTDTPYVVGGLTQTLGSTLLLRKCVDQSYLEVTDKVVRWAPLYQEPATEIGDLLTHTAPDATFRYSPTRQSVLRNVLEECAGDRYSPLLAHELFDLLAMINSVPGQRLATPTSDDQSMFDSARLARYGDIIRRLAVPYRVVNGRAVRNTELVPANLDFAQGVVSSALDLAQFDRALDDGFLAPATRVLALSQAFASGKALPTGLGWFVQAYNGQPIAWQFGVVDGAYSSLIIKVPNRRITLILLANSDRLVAPFSLEAGDVTTSIFALTFLRSFVP